jgi:hypothetical protein
VFLFKDYTTGQKSLTITGLIISFLICLFYFSAILYKLVKGENTLTDTACGFMALAFMGPFAALYWNKRVSVTQSGIEVDSPSSETGFRADTFMGNSQDLPLSPGD